MDVITLHDPFTGKGCAGRQAAVPAVSVEAGFFDTDWRRGYWGPNYSRLPAAKRRYDPDGLFFVHHGVGSEDWSADGFTRLAGR